MKKLFSVIALAIVLFTAGANATGLLTAKAAKKLRSAADEGVKVKLVLAGKAYDVATYNLTYSAADKSPSMPPNGQGMYPFMGFNSLSVTIKTSKLDQELMDWIVNADGNAKDGQLLVVDNESGKTLKSLTFSGLKSGSYSESIYNSGLGNTVMQPTVSFVLHFTKVTVALQQAK